jgi:hypothetical protein
MGLNNERNPGMAHDSKARKVKKEVQILAQVALAEGKGSEGVSSSALAEIATRLGMCHHFVVRKYHEVWDELSVVAA